LESKKKFQGQEFAHGEFTDGSGLEMYEFKWRMHDPQTGRFWQVDPLADEYVYNSPYAFSENKVTSHIELEGLESISINGIYADLWRSVGISSSSDPKQFVANVGKEALKPRNWLEGYVAAGQIAGPLILIGIMTGGIGDGAMAEAEIKSISLKTSPTTISEEIITEDVTANAPKPRNAPGLDGIPNTSKIDAKDASGKTTKFSTYDVNGNLIKQVEAERGLPRHGLKGATKKVPTSNIMPDGTLKPGKMKVEPAQINEIPPGNNKKKN